MSLEIFNAKNEGKAYVSVFIPQIRVICLSKNWVQEIFYT